MSTHATISVQHADNTISSIYCHFDGYIEDGVGEALINTIWTLDRAEKLIQEGDLRYVKNNNNQVDAQSYYAFKGEQISIDKFNSLEDFRANMQWEEFNYLFINGRWVIVSADVHVPIQHALSS